MKTSVFDWIALLLAILGAITWGIIGLTGFTGEQVNIIVLALEPVFRPAAAEVVRNLIYVLVGVAGIYLLYTSYKMARASRRTTRATRATSTRTEPTDASNRSDAPENTES